MILINGSIFRIQTKGIGVVFHENNAGSDGSSMRNKNAKVSFVKDGEGNYDITIVTYPNEGFMSNQSDDAMINVTHY
jgi:hypothetical protein